MIYAAADALEAARGGDRIAMERLVEQNTALIWSVARRFFGRGVEADDLFQLGSIGFIKAVQGFDSEYGTQFSTYAVPKIAGEIKRFLRDDGMIKVSRALKENSAKVWSAREAFEKRFGREPRLSELSELTNLSVEEIAQCRQVNAETASLDAPANDDGFSLLSTLHAPDGEEKAVENISLRDAVTQLEANMRAVILMRYFRDMTQQKTAQALGISQVQVSRLEKKAIGIIREVLLE